MFDEDEKKQLASDMREDADNAQEKVSTDENNITTSSRNSHNIEYSQSEVSFETKKGESASVKVSKVVDSVEDDKTIVSTTTTEKIDGKKVDSTTTTVELEHYNVSLGYHKTTKVFGTEHKDTARGETVTHTNSEVTQAEGGALREVADVYLSGNSVENKKVTEELNKKGELVRSETHSFGRNSYGTSRTDGKEIYGDREETRKTMEVQAKNAKDGYYVTVNAINKDKGEEFGAVNNSKTGETYARLEGNKGVRIRVDTAGNIAGEECDSSGNKVRDLSKKELKKELKKARRDADKYIKEVTESKNVEEYLETVPFTVAQESKGSLGAVFNGPINNNAYGEAKRRKADEYAKRVDDDRKNTTDLIALKRMQEIKAR